MKLTKEQIKALPAWADYQAKEDKIVIDPDVVYPLYLAELGMDANKFSVEVARRCMTKDLHNITGDGLNLKILVNDDWALRNLPEHPDFEKNSDAHGCANYLAHYRALEKQRNKPPVKSV